MKDFNQHQIFEFLNTSFDKPVRAMILAAGLGTRLKPWTDHHPKALAIVNGKSLLEHNVKYLQQFGIYEVIVNVHHFAGQIKNAIEENKGWGSNIVISDEANQVLETGGGLKKASWFFKDAENFVLMNADILTNLDLNEMARFHKKNKALATLATSNRITSRYFLFNKKNVLVGWRNVQTGAEKPDISSLKNKNELIQKAFSGLHIINHALLQYLPDQEKFSMVDVYLVLSQTHFIQSFDHSGNKFIDVGKPESIAKAELMFKEVER